MSENFVVATMKKHRKTEVSGMQKHDQRENKNYGNDDIDLTKSVNNYSLKNDGNINYLKYIDDQISARRKSKRAVRKDAIVMNEWVISNNKNYLESLTPDQQKLYFQTSYNYFANKFGEENIIDGQVHLDEAGAPHLHLQMVPLTQDGSLSSKKMFDRKTLLEIQSELPDELKQRGFDVERGAKDGHRKKLTVPEYKNMQKEMAVDRQNISDLNDLQIKIYEKHRNQALDRIKQLDPEHKVKKSTDTPDPKPIKEYEGYQQHVDYDNQHANWAITIADRIAKDKADELEALKKTLEKREKDVTDRENAIKAKEDKQSQLQKDITNKQNQVNELDTKITTKQTKVNNLKQEATNIEIGYDEYINAKVTYFNDMQDMEQASSAKSFQKAVNTRYDYHMQYAKEHNNEAANSDQEVYDYLVSNERYTQAAKRSLDDRKNKITKPSHNTPNRQYDGPEM